MPLPFKQLVRAFFMQKFRLGDLVRNKISGTWAFVYTDNTNTVNGRTASGSRLIEWRSKNVEYCKPNLGMQDYLYVRKRGEGYYNPNVRSWQSLGLV